LGESINKRVLDYGVNGKTGKLGEIGKGKTFGRGGLWGLGLSKPGKGYLLNRTKSEKGKEGVSRMGGWEKEKMERAVEGKIKAEEPRRTSKEKDAE